jgi:hypothetical protein
MSVREAAPHSTDTLQKEKGLHLALRGMPSGALRCVRNSQLPVVGGVRHTPARSCEDQVASGSIAASGERVGDDRTRPVGQMQ